MKRIRNNGSAVLTVRGIGPFNPGEVKEVPDNVAQELLLCDVFEEAQPARAPIAKYETQFNARLVKSKDRGRKE